MKTINVILSVLFLLLFAGLLQAQNENKKIIVITVMLCLSINIMAQCLYSPSQTIIRSNFTYACSGNAGGVVTLRNQNNTIINTPQAMKDGTRFTGTDDGVPAPYTTSLKVINIYNIITSCLTQSDINKVKGEVMLLSMYINSDTGIIMEIEFDITLFDNKWCRIEPEKYYAIEQALKSNITFNITEQGKKYTYNLCWIPVKFK